MFLMLAEVLSFTKVSKAFPKSGFWAFLASQQTHVAWAGCTLHDLIQPSFSFLVGVALVFSLGARQAAGVLPGALRWQALRRAALLVFLGIFVRSINQPMTNFWFTDTLAQIGLGYFFLHFIAECSGRAQWRIFGGLLLGYWLLFALWPLPGPGFNFEAVGVSANWENNFSGFAAHWNKNTNPAHAFDIWFLNLFPRVEAFGREPGGYATLSFIPTLATMVLGLRAGTWLRDSKQPHELLRPLLIWGAAALGLSLVLHVTGVCPIVKRIWTPAWVLWSGGCCFWMLAAFQGLTEVLGWRRWAFPLIVIGANSIAAYFLAHATNPFFYSTLKTHLRPASFLILGPAYQPLLLGIGVLTLTWLVLYWMYQRKLFLKV
jgi:predicted acyltransferase